MRVVYNNKSKSKVEIRANLLLCLAYSYKHNYVGVLANERVCRATFQNKDKLSLYLYFWYIIIF